MALRELGRRIGVPWPTIARHVTRLYEINLLGRDMAERYFVPLVIQVEQQPSRANNGRVTTTANGRRMAVENQLSLDLEEGSTGSFSGHDPPVLNQSTHDSSSNRFIEEDVRSVPVENLAPQGPRLVADYVLQVPSEIEGDQHRYLLAKNASASPAWCRILMSERDRVLVVRLYGAHPAAFLEALRQADLLGLRQRNAAAWLARTVPAIAAGREEAS